MNKPSPIQDVLNRVAQGQLSVEDAATLLHAEQAEPLGFATLDHHRAHRCGAGEVVFGAGKTAEQVLSITRALLQKQDCVLITRCEPAATAALADAFEHQTPIEVGKLSASVLVGQAPTPAASATPIPIVCAGTSDLPVAEEAALTCKAMGQPVQMVNDVGVAGLHRILSKVEAIRAGNVVVVVAGMEGALPSVVGGLVDKPVIAVPTSVGYGASFGGVAALLGMLNSCASGVTVVNIDNGFGAGVAASRINQLAER